MSFSAFEALKLTEQAKIDNKNHARNNLFKKIKKAAKFEERSVAVNSYYKFFSEELKNLGYKIEIDEEYRYMIISW